MRDANPLAGRKPAKVADGKRGRTPFSCRLLQGADLQCVWHVMTIFADRLVMVGAPHYRAEPAPGLMIRQLGEGGPTFTTFASAAGGAAPGCMRLKPSAATLASE